MDRKEFLKYSGFGLLGLIGLRGIVMFMMSSDKHQTSSAQSQQTSGSGFGRGKFGV